MAKCVLCQKFEAKPFTAPSYPPLLKFCVQESRPFSHTVWQLILPDEYISRPLGLLLVTRCGSAFTHVVSHKPPTSMSFQTCPPRPSSGVSRGSVQGTRGTRQVIIQDNAKTFKAGAKEIRDIIIHPDVEGYIEVSFEWHFNMEKVP